MMDVNLHAKKSYLVVCCNKCGIIEGVVYLPAPLSLGDRKGRLFCIYMQNTLPKQLFTIWLYGTIATYREVSN